MKTLEKVLAIGILLAVTMYFSLVSGGDIMILCTMLILAGLYYPLGFLFFNQIRLRDIFKKEAYKNVTAGKIIIAIVVGIGLSTIVVGSLFKFLMFSGANTMLISGLIVTAVAVVISLVLSIQKKVTNNRFIFIRIGIIGVIGIVLLLTSELSIVKIQYRNHPKYIEAYKNYLSDPKNEALFKTAELERYRIRMTEQEFKEYQESVNDKGRE